MSDDMVIFTRTFELLTWLLPHCEKFPKSQRFFVTQRLANAAMDFQEALFHANAHRGQVRLNHLRQADAYLNVVRLYLRLVYQWAWLTSGQYEHISRVIAEIGKLLGGWLKQSGEKV